MEKRDNFDTSGLLPYVITYLVTALLFWLLKFGGLGAALGIAAGGFAGGSNTSSAVGSCTFIVKVLPALSLAGAVLFSGRLSGKEQLAMLMGALFCGAGDVILDIDRVRLFVPGLAAFLLGHIAFLVFFLFRFDWNNPRKLWSLPILLFTGSMAWLLVPHLGSLLLPVVLYLLVITAMTASAFFARVHLLAAVGAGIFMLSDALLALAKFIFDGSPSPAVSIPVYFTGLFLLGFGVLCGKRQEQRRQASS